MPTQPTQPLAYASNRGAVYTADGYGVTVRVRHGRLIVEDGFGAERLRREYTRVTEPIARLIAIGTGGSVSLESLAWLRDVGAAFVHLSRDGRLIATSAGEGPDARLRRAQALAGRTGAGLQLARRLLRQKLDGQHAVLTTLTADRYVVDAFAYASASLDQAETIAALVDAERDAALAYWSAWADLEVRFRPADREQIPAHWARFGQRTSPLTSSPRLAVNPANAMLNLCYALLEAETRIALLAVGLDPGLGVIHADVRGRDSLALDLMETVRPDVDRHLLGLIRSRPFAKRDFAETRRGDVRICPPLARDLGDATRQWATLIAPVTEHTAKLLAESAGSRTTSLSTPLTSSNRKAAHASERKRPPRPARPTFAMPACKRCGQPVPRRERVYCGGCLAVVQRERYDGLLDRKTTKPRAVEPEPRLSVARLHAPEVVERATSRRCKTCGQPVPHRKRVLCDSCFDEFQLQLVGMRRPCKNCGKPVPHRKRMLCDACVAS